MEFKERLALLRKEKHLNQEEFAKKLGYTRTAISAWEVGRNEPSNADTIKIADFIVFQDLVTPTGIEPMREK